MRIPFLGIDLAVKRADTAPTKAWSPTDDRWYGAAWPFMGKNGNKTVTPESSVGCSAVYSGLKVISETIGTIPLNLYKRKGEDKREKATENSLFQVLRSLTNPNLTAMEFREMMTAHMVLRGNGFAQIIRGGDGQVVAMYPLHPNRMALEWEPELQEYIYVYSLSNGEKKKLLREQVFHLRGPSEDGLWGKSFVAVLRDLIGQNLTLDEYSHNFYKNNAAPSGVLQMAAGMEMTQKAKDNLRDEWKKKYSGANNSGSVAILEEGLTWQQIGMTSQDAQFIDTLKDVRRQILGCLRVPLHMAGDPEKLSFNSIEQLSIQFITYTMLPYLVRWEQTVARDLLTVKERVKYFAEFQVDGLQRGDLTSRYSAYAIGRQWGWLAVNDIRRFENLDPIEGGDVYLQPLNMIDATEALDYLNKNDANSAKPPGNKSPTDNNDNPTLKNSEIHAILNARAENRPTIDLSEVLEKIANIAEKVDKIAEKEQKSAEKEQKQPEDYGFQIEAISESNLNIFSEILARAMRKEGAALATAQRKGKMDSIEEDFYEDHKTFIRDSLSTAVRCHMEQIFIVSRANKPASWANDVTEVLNKVVERYCSAFKNAGDSVDARAFELALEVSAMVQQRGLEIVRG